MSELLKEAKKLEDKALDDFYASYKMPFENGYFQGVEDTRKLIEKHEELNASNLADEVEK